MNFKLRLGILRGVPTNMESTVQPYLSKVNRLLLLPLLASCYLTSQKPTGNLVEVTERDRKINAEINEVMSESGNILRDMHRLASFSLGHSVPKGVPSQASTDLPQYLTLFDILESEPLTWQSEESRRFSRLVWNEASYLMQRENPNFRFRIEGKTKTASNDPELIVFALDTKEAVDAKGSDVVLTAKKSCAAEQCYLNLRIDYKAMAKNFSSPASSEEWTGTSGILSARVNETNTTAEFSGFAVDANLKLPIVGDRKVKFGFEKVSYNRLRESNLSNIDAQGVFYIEGETKGKFEVKGNLRDASSMSFRSSEEK
ncbi:MAG: hypothetical protein RL189_783 [Pseudomonadota bacterium]|jgi:hypothetical protein